MVQLQKWKLFYDNPETIVNPMDQGALLVILHKSIFVQPILSIMQAEGKKASEIDWDTYGYATALDGRIYREGRFYLSKDMEKIKSWCKENDLQYRWGPGYATEPQAVDNLLEVHGKITQEAIDSFPVPFVAMQTHSIR